MSLSFRIFPKSSFYGLHRCGILKNVSLSLEFIMLVVRSRGLIRFVLHFVIKRYIMFACVFL